MGVSFLSREGNRWLRQRLRKACFHRRADDVPRQGARGEILSARVYRNREKCDIMEENRPGRKCGKGRGV